MRGNILSTKVIMIGIDLPKPFPLAFGTLSTLPRVFIILTLESDSITPIRAIGEASIDFPFSHYDAWDVYNALSNLSLNGLNVNDRVSLLTDPDFRSLLEFPAAFAAFNMCLDDAFGRLNHISIPEIYGQHRNSGAILESISMPNEEYALKIELERVFDKGNIPKLKCGQHPNVDIQFLLQTINIANKRNRQFAVDFNAAHSTKEFADIIDAVVRSREIQEDQIIFFEQPTLESLGINGLHNATQLLAEYGLKTPVMADESFVTRADAITCSQLGILLNFKIQKIGGILIATEIEKSLPKDAPYSMVGGTFPTALGRVWDQQGICVIKSAQLPCDAWQPSSDWFSGDRHLIEEPFTSAAFISEGLGITVRWNLLERYRIQNPLEEYRLIRNGKSGKQIQIFLREGNSYPEMYTKLTGKKYDWNI